jgi:preprotein translocase subunit SecG
MIYGLLLSVFIFCAFLLVLLILIQQGKGSMGLGSIGGSSQILFGGSGGQDIFQKITWTLGSIFMAGSLILALMKAASIEHSGHYRAARPVTHQQAPLPDDFGA